jgi:hypothetical protein
MPHSERSYPQTFLAASDGRVNGDGWIVGQDSRFAAPISKPLSTRDADRRVGPAVAARRNTRPARRGGCFALAGRDEIHGGQRRRCRRRGALDPRPAPRVVGPVEATLGETTPERANVRIL